MKCPNCQTELIKELETGIYTCPNCNASFKPKKIDPPINTYSMSESNMNVSKTSKSAKKQKTAHAKNFTNSKKIIALVIAAIMVIITVVPLCTFFIGLRGIYVAIDDPNDFISFNPIKVVNGYWDIDSDSAYLYLENGTWKLKNGKLYTTYVEDNNEYTSIKDYKKLEDGYIKIGNTIYKKVSSINYNDNIKKVKVTFDTNGGSCDDSNLTQKFIMGNILTEIKDDPYKQNYKFVGWYKDPLLRDGALNTKEAVWEDTTYYAAWSGDGENSYTITLIDNFGQVLGYYPALLGSYILRTIGNSIGTYINTSTGDAITSYDIITSDITIQKYVEYSDTSFVSAAQAISSMVKTAINTYTSNNFDDSYSLDQYFGYINQIYSLYKTSILYTGVYNYITTAKQTINSSLVDAISNSGLITSMTSFETIYSYAFSFSTQGNYRIVMHKDYNLQIDYSYTIYAKYLSVTCYFDSQRDAAYKYTYK